VGKEWGSFIAFSIAVRTLLNLAVKQSLECRYPDGDGSGSLPPSPRQPFSACALPLIMQAILLSASCRTDARNPNVLVTKTS
jgi:hypothetical protein